MDYLELYFWYLHAFIIIKQRIFPISSQSSLGRQVYPERNSVNPAGYGIRRDIHSVDRAEKSDSSCYDKRTEQQRGYFVTLWRFPLRPSVGKESAGKRHRGLHPRCILSGAVVWWNRGGRTADPIQRKRAYCARYCKRTTKYNAMSERCKR